MPKYVIERELPGAGKLTPEELKAISQTSCGVLDKMGPQIQWVHSYVTADKIYCVYNAPNEEMIREHARLGGFPANSVSSVTTMIDPVTGCFETKQFKHKESIEIAKLPLKSEIKGVNNPSKLKSNFPFTEAFRASLRRFTTSNFK